MKIEKINISLLDRVMGCPGHLFMIDLPKFEKQENQTEGIVASEYLEYLLKGVQPPVHSKDGRPFTEDMKFYLKEIANDVLKLGVEINTETVINWQSKSGIWVNGRYDFSYVYNNTLYIHDLKWGWGIVEPEKNWQLIGYAIGEMIRRNVGFNEIVLVIEQPRPHHEKGTRREWKVTFNQIEEFQKEIDYQLTQVSLGHKALVTGEHCKYCPAAAGDCPAINKALYTGVDVIQEFVQDDMTEKQLAEQFKLIERVEEVMKIKKSSLEQLITVRIKEGKVVPGYTIKPSYGHRNWKPGITPDVVKNLTGIDIRTEEILSPAKAEKLGVPKKLVAQMTEVPFLGNKVKKTDVEFAATVFGSEAPKQVE